MTFWLIRRIRNMSGVGHSGCGICGDKWNWKKPHSIAYDEYRGAFPTCEECWQKAFDGEIIGAAESLASIWRRQSPPDCYEDTDRQAILMVNAVKEALKTRQTP